MFEAIKEPTRALVELQKARNVDDSFLRKRWDTNKLVAFAQRSAAEMGFDFERGRLDITTNAFCSNCSCDDVRMTTRDAEHIDANLHDGVLTVAGEGGQR